MWRDRERLSWLNLPRDVLSAPKFQDAPGEARNPDARGTRGALDGPLCDPRLDELIADSQDLFDCIVISHIPLSQQDGSISQDVNETRIWVRGRGRYDRHPTDADRLSEAQMHAYLANYVDLIKEIHDQKQSLLFHPHIFDVKKDSPPICRSQIYGTHTYEEPKSAPPVEPGVSIEADLGYHRTETLSIYESAHVDEIRERVEARVRERDDGTGLQRDAELALIHQHYLVHDYLASMVESQPSPRWSVFLACPTGILQQGETGGFNAIPPNIVGMFWIALVGRRRWRAAEQKAEEEILRSVWTLLTSNHLTKRQSAIRRLGHRDFLSTVSHDLRRLVGAISGDTAPEALEQIHDFFLHMLRESTLSVPTAERAGEAKEQDLVTLVQSAGARAARLEEVVLLVNQGRIANREHVAASFNAAVGDFRRLLGDGLASTLGYTLRATSNQLEAFEMALVAAIRNIISHTRKTGDPEARVEFSCQGDILEIRNVFRTTAPRAVTLGAPAGTVGSLRYYASLYAPTSRRRGMVALKREYLEPLSPPHWVDGFCYLAQDHWLTILPMPLSEEAGS